LIKPFINEKIDEMKNQVALFNFFNSHLRNKQKEIDNKTDTIIKDYYNNKSIIDYKTIKNNIDQKLEQLVADKQNFLMN